MREDNWKRTSIEEHNTPLLPLISWHQFCIRVLAVLVRRKLVKDEGIGSIKIENFSGKCKCFAEKTWV